MEPGARHGRRDGVRTKPGGNGLGPGSSYCLPKARRARSGRAGTADAASWRLVTQCRVTGTALPPALDSHTLLVAAVIVHDEAAGRVLLLQRGAGSKFAPLHWDLPSGKADKGESVTAAAARELKEETGLTVDPAALRVAGIIHGAWGVEAPNGFLTVIFAARKWDGQPVNAEPRKHAQVPCV
jgi:ADP-ribose pyrophosphatase YjhB (NUDIX family)